MTLYLQDGGATSHKAWCEEALSTGVADGAIISPFFTPQTPRKGQPTGEVLADRVRSCGGEAFFDATTHGVLLPGADNFTSYNTWDLWEGSRGDLSTTDFQLAHISRVFARQDLLSVPHLVPTVALDSPLGADADTALSLGDLGRASDPAAWQSLAGRRGFWLSDDLDIHVGALAQLRAPVWFVTVIRERGDYPPDLTDVAQAEAVCRTVNSLARRSRVVLCHADMAGLPAVAAGAGAVGTGWHTKQRVCAPLTFQRNDPDQIRQQAIWLTYEGLMARLHANESEILSRADAPRARRLYAGDPSPVRAAARVHHLAVVRSLVDQIDTHGADFRARVATLRELYENAIEELNDLGRRYGRAFTQHRAVEVDGAYAALEAYATAEGLWA